MEQDITAIFKQHKDSVFRLALNYTRSVSDAEDICQTVFLKLLHQPSIKPGAEGKEWYVKGAQELKLPWINFIDSATYTDAEGADDGSGNITITPEEKRLYHIMKTNHK